MESDKIGERRLAPPKKNNPPATLTADGAGSLKILVQTTRILSLFCGRSTVFSADYPQSPEFQEGPAQFLAFSVQVPIDRRQEVWLRGRLWLCG